MALRIHGSGQPLSLKAVFTVRKQLYQQWISLISFRVNLFHFPPAFFLLWIHNSCAQCEAQDVSVLDLPIETLTKSQSGPQLSCLAERIPVKPISQTQWRGCLILPWATCWCFILAVFCAAESRAGLELPGNLWQPLSQSNPFIFFKFFFNHLISTCMYKWVTWLVYQAWPRAKMVSEKWAEVIQLKRPK